MPYFQVLLLKEHVYGNTKQLDNRIFFLYDPTDENFYYYGGRNDNGQSKYVEYSGTYHISRFDALLEFISFTCNKFSEVFTTELHYIKIDHKEYAGLTQGRLMHQLAGNHTLVTAYDQSLETRDTIAGYLDMLVPL